MTMGGGDPTDLQGLDEGELPGLLNSKQLGNRTALPGRPSGTVFSAHSSLRTLRWCLSTKLVPWASGCGPARLGCLPTGPSGERRLQAARCPLSPTVPAGGSEKGRALRPERALL